MLDQTVKYLGEFEIEYQETEYSEGEPVAGIEYDNDFMSLGDFVRVNDPTLFYHGVMGLTNISAYAVKLSDCGDSLKLFLLY